MLILLYIFVLTFMIQYLFSNYNEESILAKNVDLKVLRRKVVSSYLCIALGSVFLPGPLRWTASSLFLESYHLFFVLPRQNCSEWIPLWLSSHVGPISIYSGLNSRYQATNNKLAYTLLY